MSRSAKCHWPRKKVTSLTRKKTVSCQCDNHKWRKLSQYFFIWSYFCTIELMYTIISTGREGGGKNIFSSRHYIMKESTNNGCSASIHWIVLRHNMNYCILPVNRFANEAEGAICVVLLFFSLGNGTLKCHWPGLTPS